MSEQTFAVVTGGSRGIGFSIARTLARNGCSVYIFARNRQRLQSACEQIRSDGGVCEGLQVDVRNPQAVEHAFSELSTKIPKLHVLVNNAGIGVFAPIEHMSIETFDDILKTNVYGVFYCMKYALPLLKRAHGSFVINIGSLAGVNTFVGGGAYCASKFALRALSDIFMLEHRYDNIRVTLIAPGSVDTEFGGFDTGAEWKLRPEDIAEMVMALIQSRDRALASYIEMRPLMPPRKT